jgi:glycine/D-amino acid oxidase-like deaminating enzyme
MGVQGGMKRRYDLVVLGGGTAGLIASLYAARAGARVALLEQAEQPGGDCMFTGCVPSKSLIASAQRAHDVRTADRLGLEPSEPSSLNPCRPCAGPTSAMGLVRHMRDRRDHRWSERHMSDYIDGELVPRHERRLDAHARLCPDCGRLRRSLTIIVWELRELGRVRPTGTTVDGGVIARLRSEPPPG